MMDEDLDKTKPITTLKDLEDDEEEKEEKVSRTQKNKNILENEIEKEKEEEAEEALAEKNIAMAEALISEDKEEKKDIEELKPPKESLFNKIKDKWSKLDKKKKILFICLLILIIALIIGGIVCLVIFTKKDRVLDNPKDPTPSVEEAPVIADNFYYKEGKLYFLDDNDKELGVYECENKSAELCFVGFNNTNDTFDVSLLLDEKGDIKAQRYPIVNGEYAYVVDHKNEDDKTIKLYSIKEKKVLKEYQDVKVYDNNYAIVASNNKYGLIQVEDGITELIKEQYDYLGMIYGEKNLIAKYNKGYKVIDKSNKSLSSNYGANYEIKNYNDNFVVAKVDGEYTVYDYKGSMIDGDYDFITIKNNYIFLVKDEKLYIKDKDNKKYNEGNIKLKNKNYVKTYIYNQDGGLEETKLSFDINITNKNELQILVYENGSDEPDAKTINSVEALANEKYDYINYFDGSLFFYDDLEKENLIGSYTCSNANDVKAAEDEYTNCFLAKDTIYEDNDMVTPSDISRHSTVPIINKRYVFIADGTNNIILYDLEAKKALVENGYTNINSYTPNNDNKVTLYNGKVDVIALGKKGKYGMITVDEDKVTTKYYFNYNKMEKLGDYVVALDTTNKWKVLFGNSTETAGFDSKIRGYNSTLKYFKTMIANEYVIYDYNGGTINSDSYAYVELYSDYYAAVDKNSNLYLYDYYGTKISNEGIKIGNYAYFATASPAFKVTKDGSSYEVAVFNGSSYDIYKLNQYGGIEQRPDVSTESDSTDNQD